MTRKNPFQSAIQRMNTTESWDWRRNPASGITISNEVAEKWEITSLPTDGKSARQKDSWRHVLEELVESVPKYIFENGDHNEQKKYYLLELITCLANKLVVRVKYYKKFEVACNSAELKLYIQVLDACAQLLYNTSGFDIYCRNVFEATRYDPIFQSQLKSMLLKISTSEIAAGNSTSGANFFQSSEIITSVINRTSELQTVEVLRKIVNRYKSSSIFISSPGPELAAIKTFLSGKEDDKEVDIREIQIAILRVSSQFGAKSYREKILMNPYGGLKIHLEKDDTGVDKIIRAMGKAFFPVPVVPVSVLRR